MSHRKVVKPQIELIKKFFFLFVHHYLFYHFTKAIFLKECSFCWLFYVNRTLVYAVLMLCYFHRTHVKTNPFEKCHFLRKYISYLSNLMLHSLCIPSSVSSSESMYISQFFFPLLFSTFLPFFTLE